MSFLMSTLQSGMFGIFRSVIIEVAGKMTLTIDNAATIGRSFQLGQMPILLHLRVFRTLSGCLPHCGPLSDGTGKPDEYPGGDSEMKLPALRQNGPIHKSDLQAA